MKIIENHEPIIDCWYRSARETEREIWTFTDAGYQFAFSQFGNPTFILYGSDGFEVLDSVSFVYPYIGLRFSRPETE